MEDQLPSYSGDFEKLKVLYQLEWGITNKDAEKPVLATYAVKTCLGFAIYSEELAVLGHITTKFNSEKTLPLIFEELSKYDGNDYEVFLVGTETESEDVAVFKTILEENQELNFNISSHGIGKYDSLAIDSQTNELFSYNLKENPIHKPMPFEKRLTVFLKMFSPASLEYKPTNVS
ncbi:MAG: hypothetical protein GOV00_00515 [Candidatus Altiarchaeota archaeon]|nr:hypothetical protein [Candidatus Altiarchaeota archaeon]